VIPVSTPQADRVAERFPLSEAERNLVAQVVPGGPDGWLLFAGAVQPKILQAYAAGEISERRALECARRTALGCTTAQRITLLGVFAEQLLQIKPRVLNAKRPPHPEALRDAAVSIVEFIREVNPTMPLLPQRSGRVEGAFVFSEARRLLRPLGFFGSRDMPTALTLHRWWVDWRKANGERRPRGRPRKA
jgi:hypothetical protein